MFFFICGGFYNTMWRNATSFFLMAIRHICKYFILLSQNNDCSMKHIPQYLFSKRFLYMTVLYITIFSVIFMNIYTPFSTTAWFNLQDKSLIMETIMFYLLAVLFLLFSKSSGNVRCGVNDNFYAHIYNSFLLIVFCVNSCQLTTI